MQSTTDPIHVIECHGSEVVDLTSFGDCLFVLLMPSQEEVKVYDIESFEEREPIHVNGLKDGSGLTSCIKNMCLYVSDNAEEHNAVHKIELTNDNRIVSWTVGSRPSGLSINISCHLIVACNNNLAIQEYKPDGTFVREISLRAKPIHAIQLTSGYFVVSCGWSNDDVVKVDSEGEVVVSYSHTIKSASPSLFSYQRRLIADEKHDCILVADCYHNRIVIISLLKDSRVFKYGEFAQPSCLYCDESRNLLVVGDLKGRIFIFNSEKFIA